jgi:hypothetical protein
VDEIRARYRLGAGEMILDLSHVALPADGRTLRTSLGAGHIQVILPDQGRVGIVAHTGLGDLNILGRHNDGWDIDERLVDGDAAYGSINLDLDVGAGEIDVERESSAIPFRLRPPTTELPPASPTPTSPPEPVSPPIAPTPPVPTSAAA